MGTTASATEKAVRVAIFLISFTLGAVSTKLISRAKKSEESKNSKDKDTKNKKPPTEEDNSENNSYEGAE
jgi:hypothetical protein